jgi:hypothetical protein
MALVRIVFFAGLVVLGAIGLFLGLVFLLATGSDGPIAISYMAESGKTVIETVQRSEDPDRYWRLYTTMGILPLVGGAAATWFGVRAFRR